MKNYSEELIIVKLLDRTRKRKKKRGERKCNSTFLLACIIFIVQDFVFIIKDIIYEILSINYNLLLVIY